MRTERFSPRKPRRSLRLAKAASVSWTDDDTVRRSRRIAAIPQQPARDNLADQRRIIEVCRRVLGDHHKVHVPRLGAPGTYSFIQLKTFARLPYAVWGFSLGSLRRVYWLGLTKTTGEYTLGYRHQGPDGTYIKRWGNERIVDEVELRAYLQWEEDHPRSQQPAAVEQPLHFYPPEVVLGWLLGHV